MNAVYALETLEQVRAAGVEQLLERHWQEVAFYKDIPLAVDWEVYAAVEAAGRLRIFTARIAGELVGYCAYSVGPIPVHRSLRRASQDVLFLAPEHRKGRIGVQLLLFSERQLRDEGVQVVVQHSKARKDLDLGPLLERLGYEQVEAVWGKRLDRG